MNRVNKLIDNAIVLLNQANEISKKEQTGGILPFLIPLIAAAKLAIPLAAKGALIGSATYAGQKLAEKVSGKGLSKKCDKCKKIYKYKHTCPKKKASGLRIVAKPQ